MRFFILVFSVFLLSQCKPAEYALKSIPVEVEAGTVAENNNVLIVDVVVIDQDKPRNTMEKREVLKEIHDKYLMELASSVEHVLNKPAIIDSTYTGSGDTDAILELMENHKADVALIIRRFEAGFIFEEVTESETEGVYSKVASYSAFCSTKLDVYDQSGLLLSKTVEYVEPAAHQSVFCGVEPATPSYKDNSEPIREVAEANIDEIVGLFNPE